MSDETPQEPTHEPTSTPAEVPATPAPGTPPPPPYGAGFPDASMATTGAPVPPSHKKGKRTLALVIAALVVVGAGGAAFAFMQLRGSSDMLMRQVPASADIVATVYLDPAAGQKMNLFRMTDQFPVLGSESDIKQRLNTVLDQAGQGMGLNHSDFQWLGSQAAVVVDFPGAASPNIEVLINVDDVDAAKATLTKVRTDPALGGGETWKDAQYKGVTISSSSGGPGAYAFVGDTLVISNTASGVESIIDTDQGGPSLADSSDLKATSDGLPDGRLAFVYVNAKALLPLAQAAIAQSAGAAAGTFDMSGFQAIRGIGITVSAESDGLAMDVNESLDPTKLTASQKAALAEPHDNPLTSYVPTDAFGLAQAEHVDTMITGAITQLEAANPDVARQLSEAGVTGPDGLLSVLTGDIALEVGPGTPALPVSGALIVGIDDQTKFADAVTKLKDLVAGNQRCSFSAVGQAINAGNGQVASNAPSPSFSSDCTSQPAPKWETEDYKGTTINFVTDHGSPSIAYATVDGAGFVGIGPDSIKALIDAKAGQNITSNANFTTAQKVVPSQSSFFYVDLHGVLQAAATNSSDPSLSQAVTVLEPIKAIAIGAESASDHTHVRFMILIP
ncbi:MAG: hypothetical protein QOE83_98 [Actinomycetota bacterium]|nr:hypothetical protein [Actinomycetota bacterium]